MGDTQTHDVVVVGGGPVGLGLAIELGQRGIRVAVVERATAMHTVPKGQNLTQRTTEHFHFWGCGKELRAARVLPAGYDAGGLVSYRQILSDYAYEWLPRHAVRQFYFTDNERLPQYATENVLRARAGAIPEITIFYGWSGEEFEQDGDGVEVSIRSCETGAVRNLRGAYCVGCDGSQSAVRAAAGLPQDLSAHDRLMVLLVFRASGLQRLLSVHPPKSFYNVLHPDLDGYWQFLGRVDLGTTWFFHSPVPPGTTRENFDFKALLHSVVGQPFDLELDHVGFWELRFAVARQYRSGRIFIAGDAAHSHPPYGGYGINTGFEDSRNLGWKLAAQIRGWAGAGLLDSYSAERQPVFASTARDFIENFIIEDRAFLRRYSPEKDEAEFASRWRRRNADAAEVRAFEPNYEGSPIVFGGGAGPPSALGDHRLEARAGHHLAPALLSDGRNIYDALGRDFALLAFGADPDMVADFRQSAGTLGIPLRVIGDDESQCQQRYRAPLVLVRPDNFIAWVGANGPAEQILATAIGSSDDSRCLRGPSP